MSTIRTCQDTASQMSNAIETAAERLGNVNEKTLIGNGGDNIPAFQNAGAAYNLLVGFCHRGVPIATRDAGKIMVVHEKTQELQAEIARQYEEQMVNITGGH